MPAKPEKTRRRDMWRAIPWKRRAEIERKIKKMPDGDRKRILSMAFLDGMSTAEIERAGVITSRNHRPMSKRRILQIIAEEVPDYNAYQRHSTPTARKDHSAYSWAHRAEKERCALCGASDGLEWHHMIPVFLGGTAEPENMVCLCGSCHDTVTAYQRKLFPHEFSAAKDA